MSKLIVWFVMIVIVLSLVGCSDESGSANTVDESIVHAEETSKSYDVKALYIETLGTYNVPAKVQNWVSEEMKIADWNKSVLVEEGITYVLIKSSLSPTDGVEWDGLKIEDQVADILYQTFDYHEARPNLHDYLLVRLNGDFKVNFIETVSTSE